ncbi:uncharacterized protein LOC119108912 [Pollicipes pollicipes]|uniref:uncharacterized protein LOC119108912 n=1 Tax=Pollicipes pollicipes TaxID=41117 RepID=UPI001884A466|nr:uncharacterized protein LOC119108912 [Pollicipes pollicipes]
MTSPSALVDGDWPAFAVTSDGGLVYVWRPDQLVHAQSPVVLTLVTSLEQVEASTPPGDEASAPVTSEGHAEGVVVPEDTAAWTGNITVLVWLTDGDDAVCGDDVQSGAKAGREMCASKYRENECTSTCGAGANDTCSWRPAAKHLTELYGTCSPDLDTCPDGTCDPLEELSSAICPQDCAADSQEGIFLRLPAAGRGIKLGRGVCFCHSVDSCVCSPSDHLPLDSNVSEPDGGSGHAPHPEPVDGMNCGTSCIVGITLGLVLLLALIFFGLMAYDTRCGRPKKLQKDPLAAGISLSLITADMDMTVNPPAGLTASAQYSVTTQLLEAIPMPCIRHPILIRPRYIPY